MPTACEPCPGNTIASFMASHCRERRAPGEAAAHPLHHHAMPGAYLAGAHVLVECERHGGGRGVAVMVHGHHQALERQAELARRGLEDAHVGLVRDEPVDVGELHAGGSEGLARHLIEHLYRELEHLSALPVD